MRVLAARLIGEMRCVSQGYLEQNQQALRAGAEPCEARFNFNESHPVTVDMKAIGNPNAVLEIKERK